ncbi:hypothetical protein IFR04_010975 [Cadophora malorum]|uniref:Uncharacterized protein n=1 Tax=Cadophora malorum TaxID=108018 RepID=A0A8H7W3K3_9HELO|nr:hypothetical protein IFR04_010975 [Cadophora malorum]
MAKSIEDQACSRIRRITTINIHIVAKFMLDGAFDDERLERLKEKALPDFYANTAETETIK